MFLNYDVDAKMMMNICTTKMKASADRVNKAMMMVTKATAAAVSRVLVCFVAQMETGRLKTGSHRAADRKQ